MSYARKSTSDLYLVGTTGHGGNIIYECMSCELMDKVQQESIFQAGIFYEIYPTYIMHNHTAMMRHLRHHMLAGHQVNYETIVRVLSEYYDKVFPKESKYISDEYSKLFAQFDYEQEE
jgi:hypothetical protein